MILSDGTETEPNYFNGLKRAWRLSALKVPNRPLGQAKQVIAEAIKQRQEHDEVWCVVDKDDLDSTTFDTAIGQATGNVYAAWSNESFELWFVLHYTNAPARGVNARDRYIKQLDRLMPTSYNKVADHWTTLEPLLATALQNADTLMTGYTSGESPSACCPGTRVQDLIRTLQAEREARG
ncbi:RloB family protein [Armatimonas sp.]|uniref:RloB family protein n=1 Tax=Armatimonas sp. TaxID=1872638 RepID=UPI0037530073